ncbi:DUF3800 domain-containing protein [Saccharolobus islandicus]|uniref:DUF3800 domain-containing protein n=1 Tax=Saccharolobus islandicus TaxID=43080 RepID=UPI0003756076|nr:DUF3800 domain-containing protein [Sulfolobus islandicus]
MYVVYIDESRRDDRNRVVLGGIVIHDKYIQNVNNIFTNIILSEVNRIVNENKISSDDLIIHMKEFINDKDMVNKLLKNIGIRRDEITEIKRRIIFNIVEALGNMDRKEVFAVATRIEKRLTLDLKYKFALKFVLERIAMNIKREEPILVVFDTPGRDFRANEIYETYRRWIVGGIIDEGDKRPSFTDLRMRYFNEILTSREGDRIHRAESFFTLIEIFLYLFITKN